MAKLAINGGEPVVKGSLGKSWPIFDETEENALLETLRSGAWNRREKVDEAGEKFAAFQDAKYGIPLANGTVALQCALKAAGVSAGDEVIVPALTFVATGTSAVCVNAVPVIVDIDPFTYNIAPDAIEKAITPRTRAIIPVHNGGYPADMDTIMEIAERHNLKVIEDCRACTRFTVAWKRTRFNWTSRCIQLSNGKDAHLWRRWDGVDKRRRTCRKGGSVRTVEYADDKLPSNALVVSTGTV